MIGSVDARDIPLKNADFSLGALAWSHTTPAWRLKLSSKSSGEARTYARLEGSSGTGILLRSLPMKKYRGHVLRMSASVRTDPPAEGSVEAQIWARIDRESEERGFFDNMSDRPVRDTRWTRAEVLVIVDADADTLVFGALCSGRGAAEYTDFRLEDLGRVEDFSPRRSPRLDARHLGYLEAVGRLWGALRWFHPTDLVEQVDWNAFLGDGVRRALDASNDRTFHESLREYVALLAPSVQILSVDEPARAPSLPDEAAGELGVSWWHHGLGAPNSIYQSRRRFVTPDGQPLTDADELPEEWRAYAPTPGEVSVIPLTESLRAVVPLSLVVREGRVVPTSHAPELDRVAWGVQRQRMGTEVRLASTLALWEGMRHFFPYFEEVGVDWDAQLEEALLEASLAEGVEGQWRALRRLAAKLEDGHVSLTHPRLSARAPLPLTLAWIDDALVVVSVSPALSEVRPGDVVERIGGERVAQLVDANEALVSASHPAARRAAAAFESQLGPWDPNGSSETELSLRRGSRRVKLTLPHVASSTPEQRPAAVAWLDGGVAYVDLTRIDDDDWESWLPRLTQAKGLLFDMRGYPGALSSDTVLPHLSKATLNSSWWRIPQIVRPTGAAATHSAGRWELEPKSPQLDMPKVFLTDERAISYAESLMSIVEHAELGAIVGRRTAGTNGNVNHLALPGAFALRFTGMRVRRHDGSAFHGVGVAPTHPIPASLDAIAAGRDEVFEAGLALLDEAR